MKRLIGLFLVFALLATSTPVIAAGLASSNGVDLLRGTWGGTLTTRTGPPPEGQVVNAQLNLYFNKSIPGDVPGSFKASGYSSITWEEPDKPKRAKAELLPMMAEYTDAGDGTFDVTVLATFPTPPWAPTRAKAIFRLDGTAVMSGSGVPDDVMSGTWLVKRPDGTTGSGKWSVTHLDRRSIGAPEVSLTDPTLYFRVDVVAHIFPTLDRNPRVWNHAYSNIVMNSVQVTFPDGTVKILPPYTDVFTPGVDWITEFRFGTSWAGLPVAGVPYTFTALDVYGNPIPGVQGTDVWIDPAAVPPPAPPTNTAALWTSAPNPGILVTWDAVPTVLGSFEPTTIGTYQLELYKASTVPGTSDIMVYGANSIGGSYPSRISHLVPSSKADFITGDWGASLQELTAGSYRLDILLISRAPAGSGGSGNEFNVRDPDQRWRFDLSADGSISNLRKAR